MKIRLAQRLTQDVATLHDRGEKCIPLELAHSPQGCDRISIYANAA
jgi:hypothetical protein